MAVRNPYRPWLESWLAADDPWHYGEGADADRHRTALSLLPACTGRTLEIGCSDGQFTALVAPRAAHLLAVELIPSAARRAAIRTAELTQVEVRVADATRRLPLRRFDTVICMDVLYYVPTSLLPIVRQRLVRRVRPGGLLLLQHQIDDLATRWDPESGGAECLHPPFSSHGLEIVASTRDGTSETMLLRRPDGSWLRDVVDDARDVLREPWLAPRTDSGTGRAEVELSTAEVVGDDGNGWRRRVVLRVHDRPANVAVARAPLTTETIRELAALRAESLEHTLTESPSTTAGDPIASVPGDLPVVTVAICTTGEAAGLADLLGELTTSFECHVEENGSPRHHAQALAAAVGATYAHAPGAGLAAARNRAMARTTSEWVLFVDDDVTIAPGTAAALATAVRRATSDTPDVGVVTGLVLPDSLSEPAALRYERFVSHRRGDRRVRYDLNSSADRRWPVLGADECGVGACMAVRTAAWKAVDGFDERLGAGSAAWSSEDDAFFRAVIEAGWAVVYDPSVTVRHRHRRTEAALRTQIFGYAVGTSTQLTLLGADRRDRGLLRVWLRVLALRVGRRRELPRDLWAAELAGHLHGAVVGLLTARRSRRS